MNILQFIYNLILSTIITIGIFYILDFVLTIFNLKDVLPINSIYSIVGIYLTTTFSIFMKDAFKSEKENNQKDDKKYISISCSSQPIKCKKGTLNCGYIGGDVKTKINGQ